MTRPTRPDPRRTSVLPGWTAPLAALALLACASLTGACGALSRPIVAQYDSTRAKTPEQRDVLVGADPMLSQLWMWSAQRQLTAEAAQATLQRGLSFGPGFPGEAELRVAQVSLVGFVEQRFSEAVTLARAGLQSDCPTYLEAELRWMLVVADLALNDTAAAEAEVIRLGGVRGVPPMQVADAWARIAVTQEFLGRPELADPAFERSLDLGPLGFAALREIAATQPQRQAACDSLVARARQRHPDHPDLAVQQVLSALLAQNATAAEAALAALPTPLPGRFDSELPLLTARVDVLAGRTGPALVVIRERLDDNPGDIQALSALIECWRLRQVPTREEMRLRLTWAAGRINVPAMAAQVQALLRELPPPPAEEPAPN